MDKMRAFEATIRVRLIPENIGPDTTGEWSSDASACDFLSDLMADNEHVLDWGYVDSEHPWLIVESSPSSEYEMGEMFAEHTSLNGD
jgi:hypothetical protein